MNQNINEGLSWDHELMDDIFYLVLSLYFPITYWEHHNFFFKID